MGECLTVFSLYMDRRIIEMAVKYPEFNELKKESAFDWLVKSEGEDFKTNKAIIRLDMFHPNRKVSISNDMKKAILILVTKKGILTPIEPSDGIINHDMTETLMQMAMDYKGFEMPEVIMPNIEIVNKGESDGGNISIHYDSLLTVQGDVTKDALPDLKTILKQASEYTQNDIRKNRRRFG